MTKEAKERQALCEKIISTAKEIMKHGKNYRFIAENYTLEPLVEPPKHWIKKQIEDGSEVLVCPRCGRISGFATNFCADCGLELRGKVE